MVRVAPVVLRTKQTTFVVEAATDTLRSRVVPTEVIATDPSVDVTDSILSVLRLLKLVSTSVLVNGDPLTERRTIVDIYYPNQETVIVQVMLIASSAPLLTTENTVRQSIVPAEAALKMPASVTAPVPVPAGNDAT